MGILVDTIGNTVWAVTRDDLDVARVVRFTISRH
jgi:hypothetical protein